MMVGVDCMHLLLGVVVAVCDPFPFPCSGVVCDPPLALLLRCSMLAWLVVNLHEYWLLVSRACRM